MTEERQGHRRADELGVAETGRSPDVSAAAELDDPDAGPALAGDSKAHDIRRVEAAARLHLPHVETTVLPGLTHHGVPFTRAAAIDSMLLDFLGKP